jgi:hypothetical protein
LRSANLSISFNLDQSLLQVSPSIRASHLKLVVSQLCTAVPTVSSIGSAKTVLEFLFSDSDIAGLFELGDSQGVFQLSVRQTREPSALKLVRFPALVGLYGQ